MMARAAPFPVNQFALLLVGREVEKNEMVASFAKCICRGMFPQQKMAVDQNAIAATAVAAAAAGTGLSLSVIVVDNAACRCQRGVVDCCHCRRPVNGVRVIVIGLSTFHESGWGDS